MIIIKLKLLKCVQNFFQENEVTGKKQLTFPDFFSSLFFFALFLTSLLFINKNIANSLIKINLLYLEKRGAVKGELLPQKRPSWFANICVFCWNLSKVFSFLCQLLIKNTRRTQSMRGISLKRMKVVQKFAEKCRNIFCFTFFHVHPHSLSIF